MTRLIAGLMALTLMLGGATDAMAQKKDNTGRNVAIGVAAGVAAAIILNNAAKADGRRDKGYDDCPGDSVRNRAGRCVKEYEPVYAKPRQTKRYQSNDEIRGKCRYFLRKCDNGERWACGKARDYCDRG